MNGKPNRLFMYWHAKKRAKERYGQELSPTLNKHIARKIKEGKVIKQTFLSWTRDKVRYYHDGKIFELVWDKNKEQIVTFLPTTQKEER